MLIMKISLNCFLSEIILKTSEQEYWASAQEFDRENKQTVAWKELCIYLLSNTFKNGFPPPHSKITALYFVVSNA